MERVRLTKDGRLLMEKGAQITDAPPALGCAVVFDEGCTLRSFHALFQRYPLLCSLSEFIPASVNEMDACPVAGCVNDDMHALVLGKTMELIGFPGKPRAELYLWLRGLEKKEADAEKASEGEEPDTPFPKEPKAHLSLTGLMEANKELRFVPMQFLLDMPVYLGGLRHLVLGDMNRALFCESRFTLFEVIDGVAWELGFRGGKEQCYI